MTLGSLSAVAQDDLWFRLSQVSLDVEGAAFPFSSRLARDNGWSEDFAVRVIEEYRRLAYLAVTGAEEVTPSDAVDQAWHLHLTYTRHYWGEWTAALGTELHHGPTKGGHLEAERFEGYDEAERLKYAQIAYLFLDNALGENVVETEIGFVEYGDRSSQYFDPDRNLTELWDAFARATGR